MTSTTTTTTFEESWVVSNGTSVRVLQAGAGEPVVLVPGSDGLQLTRGHALLARECRLMAFDVPGGRADALVVALDQQALEQVTLLASSDAVATALEVCRQRPDSVRALILESPRGADSVAFEAQLASLTQPTLVVCGTRDTIAPPATGRRYRELIPRCHFIVVYDAGHMPSRDRPEAFAEVTGDYVQRLEAFVVQRESGMLLP